jgi:hypothetical protein
MLGRVSIEIAQRTTSGCQELNWFRFTQRRLTPPAHDKRARESREDHARNMCEFYFGQFYTIESRIKEVLNRIEVLGLADRIDGAESVRAFQREFRQELRMRGRAVHKEPFHDPDLDRLFVTRVMSASHNPSGKGWDTEHLRHYRKFSSTWSKRARRRSVDAGIYRDAIAGILLTRASFLPE